MAAPQNFRSAFNGFNREDVVNYIAYANSCHENQLAQLRSQLQSAQEELDALRSAPDSGETVDKGALEEANARCTALEAENAHLQQENADLQAQVDQMVPAEQVESLRAQLADMTQARDQALAQLSEAGRLTAQELEAYRRAERMERLAQERVTQMYNQATGALADAGCRVDAAAHEVEAQTARAVAQLSALQQAVQAGSSILQDTAAELRAMGPELPTE